VSMCDMTHVYVWHESCLCVTHIYVCVMSHIHVCVWVMSHIHVCVWVMSHIHVCVWVIYTLYIYIYNLPCAPKTATKRFYRYTYTHIHIYTYMCMYKDSYFIYKYTHTFTYTCVPTQHGELAANKDFACMLFTCIDISRIYTYIFIYINICACIKNYIIYTYLHISIHHVYLPHIYTFIPAPRAAANKDFGYIHTCTFMYMHEELHTCIYIHTYTYIYTCTCPARRKRPPTKTFGRSFSVPYNDGGTDVPVAVCCSVMPCVAVCCRMLQCVAVCCSVL